MEREGERERERETRENGAESIRSKTYYHDRVAREGEREGGGLPAMGQSTFAIGKSGHGPITLAMGKCNTVMDRTVPWALLTGIPPTEYLLT